MEPWQKLLEGELDDLLPHIEDDLRTGEFEMGYVELFTKIHQHEKRERVRRLIAGECDIADEQAELQAAWDELQAVPSYVEQQAAAFAKEEVNHE
jgi:hypothetical protein